MTDTSSALLTRGKPVNLPGNKAQATRAHCMNRIEAMRSYRMSWWSHWALLAEMFLPRRYRWFISPNVYNRGSPMNQAIVDETGVLAARVLATGLLADLTSPTKPWFRLGLAGRDIDPASPEARWLAKCEEVILRVYAESNFYQALGTAYHDLAVFGSAALIQYEDSEDVVRFYNPCLGEFFFAVSNRLEVDTLAREYTYTIRETVQEFGLDAVSDSVRTAFKSGGANLETEVVISHIIEPNTTVWYAGEPVGMIVPSMFKYREVFWESSTATSLKTAGHLLRVRGFHEKPHVGLRWDVTSNDAYGRSPGMDALPATRQLQIEQRRKAEAIDKMVRPPMVASVNMKNEPADITPGGITYVADPAASGFKPAYTVLPQIAEMKEDLQEVQSRVKECFFNDLFLMISQLDTVRTATEIDARREEKLVLLGPVIERVESEGLDDIIERTFAICARRGLFPPAPASIRGATVNIQYISMLAEAQRAQSTTAIERLFAFGGNLVGVIPDILDNVDPDKAFEKYAADLSVPPDLLRDLRDILAIRKARTEQQQQATQMAAAQQLAQTGQTLSQTDVGGGANALQSMLGTGPGPTQ